MKNARKQNKISINRCSQCGNRVNPPVIYEIATGQPVCHRCWNARIQEIFSIACAAV